MTPSWPGYNNLAHRMFPNIEVSGGMAASCLLTANPISSCMFGPNRAGTVQWFNRSNLSSDPWSGEFSQGTV